jgi:hypothetical protein
MRKLLKTGATALMLVCMAQNAWAATDSSGCARSEDISAVRATAIQQRLMVAAFSCRSIELYNTFVRSYQADLQASDRQLQNFFQRLYGHSGESHYHSFKTRLANASSLQSINDPQYCASAQATFDEALSRGRKSLTAFVATQPSAEERAFSSCEIVTASTRRIPRDR